MQMLLLLSLLVVGDPYTTGPARFNDLFGRYNPGVGAKYTCLRPSDQLFQINVNNSWGLMNQSGEVVAWPQYDWIEESYCGMVRVVKNGKTGFINIGNYYGRQIDINLESADRFSEGYASVMKGPEGVGFIDIAGKVITGDSFFKDGLRFSEGYAAVQLGDLCGFIDRRGLLVIPARYSKVRSIHEGFAAVTFAAPAGHKDDPPVLGYIDTRGTTVFTDTTGKFTELGDFREGYARVRVGKLWGYVSKDFRFRIDARFDDARDFSEGMAAVKVEDRWGYINARGDWVVEPAFQWAHELHDGSALVKVDGLFGYINRAGGWRIRPQFEDAEPYRDKLARVKTPPNFGYVGLNGNIVWDPRSVFVAVWYKQNTGIGSGTPTGSGNDAKSTSTQPPPYEFSGPPTSEGRIVLPPPRPDAKPPYPPDWKYRDRDFLPRPAEK